VVASPGISNPGSDVIQKVVRLGRGEGKISEGGIGSAEKENFNVIDITIIACGYVLVRGIDVKSN